MAAEQKSSSEGQNQQASPKNGSSKKNARSPLPEDVTRLLKPSSKTGEFIITDWAKWLGRPLARFVSLSLIAGGNQKFSSNVLGLRKTRGGDYNLLVESFFPEPDRKFWDTPRALIAHLGYVEAGLAIRTSFHANAQRELSFEGKGAVEVSDIMMPKALISPYRLEFDERSRVKLKLSARGESAEVQVTALTVKEVFFEGKLPFIVHRSGTDTSEASLLLAPPRGGEELEIPLELTVGHTEEGGFKASIRAIHPSALEKLVAFIDAEWLRRAKVRKRRAEDERRREHETMSTSMETLLKPHDYLLSDDDQMKEQLESLDVVVRQVLEPDVDYVLERIRAERCDAILADADQWGVLSAGLIEALQQDRELKRIPLLWFADEEGEWYGKRGEELVQLGSHDLLPREIELSELNERLIWATRGNALGEGEAAVVVISPSARMQYRLGIELQRADLTLHKAMSMKNPLSLAQ